MTLREKQSLFVRNLARLVNFASSLGYDLTLGDAYRDPRVFGIPGERKAGSYGAPYSNHKLRLAQDYNLFKDGAFLSDSASHRALGEFWKSLHPDNRWGGDFTKPDGNHYSMIHEGRA